MNREDKNLMLTIVWKPVFAGLMTGILAIDTSLPPLLVGAALGISAGISSYYELKKYIRNIRQDYTSNE